MFWGKQDTVCIFLSYSNFGCYVRQPQSRKVTGKHTSNKRIRINLVIPGRDLCLFVILHFNIF